MTPRGTVLLVSALLSLPGAARAEGLALGAQGGFLRLNATNSAKAVFDGSSGGVTFGGEVSYTFRNGLYLAGGANYFKKDGQRVFVADASSPVFRLGHPLSVRIIPVYGTIGYRFLRGGIFSPYVGAGGGLTSYKEESTVAGLTSTQDERKASFHLLGGIEVGRSFIRVGAEARYSRVPNAIGVGGVSKVYGETDIGGLALVGKIVVGGGH